MPHLKTIAVQQVDEEPSSMPTNLPMYDLKRLLQKAQHGDIVAFVGDVPVSWVIELTGWASHVAVIKKRNSGPLMVCASREKKGMGCMLPERIYHNYDADNKSYPGRVFLYRWENPMDEKEKDRLADNIDHLQGSDYSNEHIKKMILRWIAYHLTHKAPRNLLKPDFNHLVCSEAVWMAFQGMKRQRDLIPDPHYQFYSPASVLTNLIPVAELEIGSNNLTFKSTHQNRNQLINCIENNIKKVQFPSLSDDEKITIFNGCTQDSYHDFFKSRGLRVGSDYEKNPFADSCVDQMTLGFGAGVLLMVIALLKTLEHCFQRSRVKVFQERVANTGCKLQQ
jgi:hypothetical protein